MEALTLAGVINVETADKRTWFDRHRQGSGCNSEVCFEAFDANRNNLLGHPEFGTLCQALFKNEEDVYELEPKQIDDIFSVFDKNKDGFIDKAEFAECWDKWILKIIRPVSVLLIVDVQNDFISGNLSLVNSPAHKDGEEVVAPINQLLDTVEFDQVIFSLDWHPENHVSFIDNVALRTLHPTSRVSVEQAKVNDVVIFEGSPPMEQTLWPRHCVQDTWGAELHKDLKVPDNSIRVYKGTNPEIDSYSAFWDNNKSSETPLDSHLRRLNVTDVYTCGLAYDICVGLTSVDALESGYRTTLIADCSREIKTEGIEKINTLIGLGHGVVVDSPRVKGMVEGRDRRPELGYKLAMDLKNAEQK